MKKIFQLGLVLSCAIAFASFTYVHENVKKEAVGKNVKWYTWDEAVEANKKEKKKFFVDIYTDWCGWCKRMDAQTFEEAEVAAYLNKHFYPIKLDAEQKANIEYGGYTFKEWSGDVCDGDQVTTCTTSTEGSPTVTANFEVSCVTLTVNIIDGDHNDRAWIFRPNNLDFTSPAGEDTCTTDDTPCTVRVCEPDLGLRITIKKQGDSISWGGDCSGVPNSRDQCTVEMTQPRVVNVIFTP